MPTMLVVGCFTLMATRCRFPRAIWMWATIQDIIFSRVNQRLNRSKLLPAWKKMELISMILAMAPVTTNIHVPSLQTEPDLHTTWSPYIVCLLIFATLQHGPCNQLTRLESNQCTEATSLLGWSICWGKILHWLSLKWKFWSHSVNAKAIVHIYVHPCKSASCFNYVTLKNNHSPKDPERFFKTSAKTQPVFKKLHVWTAEAVKHQRSISGVWAPGTLVQATWHRPSSQPTKRFSMIFQEAIQDINIDSTNYAGIMLSREPGWSFWHGDYGCGFCKLRSVLFVFGKPSLHKIWQTCTKNAVESKYSGLKLWFFFVEVDVPC